MSLQRPSKADPFEAGVHFIDSRLPRFAACRAIFLFALCILFAAQVFAAAPAVPGQCYEALDGVPVAATAIAAPTKSKDHSIENLARRMSANPAKYAALQAELTAPLGHIFDIAPSGKGRRNKVIKKEPAYDIEERKAIDFLKALPDHVSPELTAFVQSELKVTPVGPGAILVKIPNAATSRPELSPAQNLFRTFLFNRFSFMARNLTTWIYQLNGLDPHSAESSGMMYDENLDYQKKGYKPDQFLLFDQAVWKIQMRYIETIWDRMQRQQIKLEELGDLMQSHPFLPFSGIVLSKSATGVVEIKRYFQNDYEDPFHLLNLNQKEDYVLRHRMLLMIVEDLPDNTPLEIHSHDIVWTAVYRKWGFEKDHEETSPFYPGVTIDILTATRETMIEKINIILARLAEIP